MTEKWIERAKEIISPLFEGEPCDWHEDSIETDFLNCMIQFGDEIEKSCADFSTEILKIKISEKDRLLVSYFMQETFPEEIDFNWLMPVVEKIENLTLIESKEFKIPIITVSIDGNRCCIGVHPQAITMVSDLDIEVRSEESKIKSVWVAVVEFIKWYNSGKQ